MERQRRSVRLQAYDFDAPGDYFVTICTKGRQLFFEAATLRDVAERCWAELPNHFPSISLDAWVVMPNHVHGIICIEVSDKDEDCRGVQLNAPTTRLHSVGNSFSSMSPGSGTLGVIMRSYKAAVTRICHRLGYAEFAWQRNYYEHIVRDERELERIRDYIDANPHNWASDEYNPVARQTSAAVR